MVINKHRMGLLTAIVLLIALGLWVSTGPKAFFSLMATLTLVVLPILFVQLIRGNDNKFIFNMAIAALILRIVIALVLHYANLVHDSDAITYQAQAAQISSDWIRWSFSPAAGPGANAY